MSLWLLFLGVKWDPAWINACQTYSTIFPPSRWASFDSAALSCSRVTHAWYSWAERVFSHSEKTMPREEVVASYITQIKLWLKKQGAVLYK